MAPAEMRIEVVYCPAPGVNDLTPLTLAEGALLAALTKGPNFFNPDRHPARVRERFVYVLQRMAEDNVITAEQMKQAVTVGVPTLVAFERPRRDVGFHFTDQVAREARTIAGVEGLTAQTYTVRSTIIPQLQRAAEAALQEGLARYEISTGRVQGRAADHHDGGVLAGQLRGPHPDHQLERVHARHVRVEDHQIGPLDAPPSVRVGPEADDQDLVGVAADRVLEQPLEARVVSDDQDP